MVLLLPLIVLQLLIPTILMNLILNIYAKASQFGNTNLVDYAELTKLPVLLDLNIQFVLPDSLVRNLRANNANNFGMRDEIGDSILNAMLLASPLIEDFLLGSLSEFINFAANDCGYCVSFTKIFVTAVQPHNKKRLLYDFIWLFYLV